MADYLVDGPYRDEERDLTLHYRGSRNQRIIDMRKALEEKGIN
jgi:anaerobic ribonucleoside-triphosphate reductase activating protein